MECKDVKDLLSLFQDGEMDNVRSEQIKSHLKSCSACQQEWRLLQQLEQEMKNLPQVEPSLSFTATIMGRVKDRQKKSWLHLPSMVYSLVFLLFFVLGFYLTKESAPTAEPENETMYITQLMEESQSLALLSVQGETFNILAGDQKNGW